MTENEALEIGKSLYENITLKGNNIIPVAKYIEFVRMAIKALEKVQEFESIGTVEELQEAKMQYDNIHSVAEKTALIGLSDYGTAKESLITEMKRSLDYSLKEYQSIGTVEEFKALKEKSVAKKPIDKLMYIECPACGDVGILDCGYCPACGQKLDWV